KKTKRNMLSLLVFLLLFISIMGSTILINHGQVNAIKTFMRNTQFSFLIVSTFIIGSMVYAFLRKRVAFAGTIFLLFICTVTYVDLFRMGYRFLTFSNEKFLYPQMQVTKFVQDASKNTLARNIGLTEPDISTYLNVYSIETYNALY